MTINTRELLDAVAVIADQHEMKVTIKHSLKGALMAGGACFVGGIILGPVGLLIGSTAGGAVAYYKSKDSFKPVSQILKEDLTPEQQEQLRHNVMTAISNVDARDAVLLIPLITGNLAIQQAILSTVVSFVTNDLHLMITDR